MYYLAIDIGASSGRHILGKLENGRLELTEIYRFENGPEKKDGSLIWNVNKLFGNIVAGMKECKKRGVIPVSVGIDTWGVDYALLDENNDLIGDIYCYRDKRNEAAAEKVEKIIPFNELYAETGIQRAVFNTVYQLYADKESGKLKKAKRLLMIADYLHFLLSGVPATEYTHASTSGLLNAYSRDWSDKIIDALGYPREIFGKINDAGTIAGDLKPEIAKEVGFNAKVILPASHDTASAVLAVPACSDTPLYLSSGTWSLLGTELRQPITSVTAMNFNATNEGGFEKTIRFLKNISGMWLIQNVKRELKGKYGYDDLMNMAKPYNTGSLIDLNDVRFLAPESMIEEVKGYCREHGEYVPETIGEVMDVIYRSLATAYKEAISATEKVTGITFDTLNIVGGGSKDGYLNELTKEYTGKNVVTGPTEGTAVGNLLAQGIALKEIKDMKAAREIVRQSFAVKNI